MGKADAQLFSWKSRRDALRSKVLGRKMPATSRGRDHARGASCRTWLFARTAGAELWVENTPDMGLCSLREKPRTSVVEYSIFPDPLPETPRHRTCPSEIFRVLREPAATGTIRDRTGARRGRGRIRPVQGQIRRLHPGRLASVAAEIAGRWHARGSTLASGGPTMRKHSNWIIILAAIALMATAMAPPVSAHHGWTSFHSARP